MTQTEIKARLRGAKLKATPRKIAIFDELSASHEPVDAYELHGRVNSRVPTDLATVYRTLSVFQKKGIVHQVFDKSGCRFFELIKENQEFHPHFSCQLCGEHTCMPTLSEEITKKIEDSGSGIEVSDITVFVSGICSKCNKDTQ